jgi:hypothetical protein
VDRLRLDREIDAIVGDDRTESARDATRSHANRY